MDDFIHTQASFRKKYFPKATHKDWNDWRWQFSNRIRDLGTLERIISLSNDEREALSNSAIKPPLSITPYFASLINPDDPNDPIRRTQIPVIAEAVISKSESDDPLKEETLTAAPGLIHRYPDRALILATNTCAGYCRYCERARLVGNREKNISQDNWAKALAYLKEHKEIRDVLVSGGDPFIMSDEKLDRLLGQLRSIKHIEILRIGTKVPMTMPQRITKDLVSVLKKHHPLRISIHAIHPSEITPTSQTALARLVDAGIPLGSQTVLLRGINDDPATMKNLMHKLLICRVTPYYILQMEPLKGSEHFRTPVQSGLDIIESLRGHTSGYAVPAYIIDTPGGGGKVQLVPNPIVGREGDHLLLRNYENKVYKYYDPPA